MVIWAKGTLKFAIPLALSGYSISSCSIYFSIVFFPVPHEGTKKIETFKSILYVFSMKNMGKILFIFYYDAYKDNYLGILPDKLWNSRC